MHQKACWVSFKAVKTEQTMTESGKGELKGRVGRVLRLYPSPVSGGQLCLAYKAETLIKCKQQAQLVLWMDLPCVLIPSCFSVCLSRLWNDSTLYDLVEALKDHVYSLLAWVVSLCTSVPGITQLEAMHEKTQIPYDASFSMEQGQLLTFLSSEFPCIQSAHRLHQ